MANNENKNKSTLTTEDFSKITIEPTPEQIKSIKACLDKGKLVLSVKEVNVSDLPGRGDVSVSVVDVSD